MLYITHDIASARYFADEVLVMYAGEIVERGPAEEVTQQPAHPYTQLLVASAPDPDNLGSTLRGGTGGVTARRLASAAAQSPENATAAGCPFNPRCPFADDRCRQEDPTLHADLCHAGRGLLAPGRSCPGARLRATGRWTQDYELTQSPSNERKTRLMRRSHSHRRLFAVGAAGLLAAGLAACSSSSSSPSTTSTSNATGKTLVMESSPESTITQDVQPVRPHRRPLGMGATGLIYEPLIQFDLAKPPTYYPWLATSYAWSNGGKTITFAIRQGVKWNDGTAFTPADVAYTFNLMKANASVNLNGLKITSVSTSGNNVVLNFPTGQYANLESIAGTAIVPQAIWSKAGNPATFADPNPVGTGPSSWTASRRRGSRWSRTRTTGRRPSSRSRRSTSRSTPPTPARSARCSAGRSTGPVTTSPACRRTSSTPTPPTTTTGRRPAATRAWSRT